MFSVTIGLTLLCTFIASIFQGFEDTVPNAWINQAVQPGAFLVFVYIFFYFHLQLTAALLAWVSRTWSRLSPSSFTLGDDFLGTCLRSH